MNRFAISDIEILKLNPEDFKIAQMSDWYLMRLIRSANELGLKGKKIKTIYRIDEQFANRQTYIDFECEESK